MLLQFLVIFVCTPCHRHTSFTLFFFLENLNAEVLHLIGLILVVPIQGFNFCYSVLLFKGLANLTSPDLQVTIIYELSCIYSFASCSVGHFTSCLWSELYTTVSLSYVIQYIRFHLLYVGSESFVCLFLFSSTALHNLKMCCITFFSGFYVSTLFFRLSSYLIVLYIQLTSQMLYAQVYTDTACYCNAIPNYRQRYLTFSIFQCTKVFKRNFTVRVDSYSEM